MMIDEVKTIQSRILVFSAYYEPEVFSSQYLTKNLYEDMAKNGWNVEIFTPLPTRGINDVIRNQYKRNATEFKCNGNLLVHRVFLPKEVKNTFIRAFRYFAMNALFIFKSINTKADIIFVQSTPPTQGLMAAIISKIKGIPFVYNLQDVFPDSLINAGMTKRNSFIWEIGRMIEHFSYKNADQIIVISESFKANLIEKGISKEKIHTVYNWVDEKEIIPIRRENNIVFQRYKLDNEKYYVTYCGNIGLSQNLDILVDAAKAISCDYPQIAFVILGDGAYKSSLEKRLVAENLTNVKLLPFQEEKYVSHVMSMGDISLVSSKKNVGISSVPSKSWNIMSAARPVLCAFDTEHELCDIIKRHNLGLCVEPENAEALKNAIIFAYNNQELMNEYGKNGRKYILENLTRDKGTGMYMSIIKSVIENSKGVL